MRLRRRKARPEIVVIERPGDSSAKWLFWGALLGAGVALLYAPRKGDETRRSLQRGLWRLRAATEERLDELMEQFGGRGMPPRAMLEEEDEDFEEYAGPESGDPLDEDAVAGEPELSAREELERRLAEARARRRRPDVEEPGA